MSTVTKPDPPADVDWLTDRLLPTVVIGTAVIVVLSLAVSVGLALAHNACR